MSAIREGASSAQSVKDSRIAELIPADAEMVMVFQNMTDVVEEYEQFLDPKLAGDHEFGNSLREIHQVFQDELGFDLGDGDFWELTGLDLDAPWVIAGRVSSTVRHHQYQIRAHGQCSHSFG